MDQTTESGLEPYSSIIREIREEIPKNMIKQNILGLAIAIISKDKVIWSEGFGYTDSSKEQKVDVDTLFGLQSTTKAITAVAFLLAVQNGKVQLDDPLVKYYPEFNVKSRYGDDEGKKITFRHLLSHRSGLTHEPRLGGVFDDTQCTWEEHIKSISGSWLKFSPGERSCYSNAGMDLVTYALERITGQSYPGYVQQELGDPLGITIHYRKDEVYAYKNAARGHLGDYAGAYTDDLGMGCGTSYTSIKALATFVRFLLNLGTLDGKEILSAEHVNEMRTVQTEGNYGLGTFINRNFGISIPNHGGGGFGFGSEMYWVPDHDIGIAIMSNQEYQGYVGSLANRILKGYLEVKGISSKSTDFPYPDAEKVKISDQKLDRLAGYYGGTIVSPRQVTLRKGKLFLNKTELVPVSETAFKAGEGITKGVAFKLDGQDNPLSIDLYLDGLGMLDVKFIGRPIDKPGLNREEWKKYEGIYRSHFDHTEPLYETIKLEENGYLHMFQAGRRLYEHDNLTNVFFTFTGEAVTFEKDGLMYNGNIKGKKVDDPVTELTELSRMNSKHRYLQGWSLDALTTQLNYLGRAREAEKIVQLKKSLQ